MLVRVEFPAVPHILYLYACSLNLHEVIDITVMHVTRIVLGQPEILYI